MLYQLHELNRHFFHPYTQWAEASAKLFSDSASPFAHTPFSPQLAAAHELMHRLGKHYEKPHFAIDTVLLKGMPIGIVEEVVVEKTFCTLLHFKKILSAKESAALQQPAVLLVAPLSGHHATLLRDTVRSLLQDHDVYITDWKDARMVALAAGSFHLHDYVHYMQDFIRTLGENLHVVAVCQSTVPVLAAISLMASDSDQPLPKSMTLMGGPIDARNAPTQVNRLATEKSSAWFEKQMIHQVPENYPGHGRKVYPGFLQHAGFIAMNPSHHMQSHWDFYQHLQHGDHTAAEEHRKFYDEYNAVLDMPAEYYLETIQTVFQEHRLPLGTWEIDGKPVQPQAIKSVALLTIEGERDDISGLDQTRAAQDLCASIPKSKKQHITVAECGHYGIFSGQRWRETVYPQLATFIAKHG